MESGKATARLSVAEPSKYSAVAVAEVNFILNGDWRLGVGLRVIRMNWSEFESDSNE